MSILVCGSMAYDSIMVFRDYFKNHIMPDQIHKLSVAFYTPEMEKNYGGTAGNIGHNLHLLLLVSIECLSILFNNFIVALFHGKLEQINYS